MRAQSSGRSLPAAGLAALLGALVGSVTADVGGGRGHPATPWRISGPEDANDLQKAKEAAAKCQALSLPGRLLDDSNEEMVELQEVSLRPTPLRAGEEGVYELAGKNAAGEPVSVSFSQLESFVVTARSEKSITLAVTVWPDIAPQDLIAKQPSYKEITAGYRREVVIEIELNSSDGRALEFAGDYGGALPLAKLTVGTKGDFYGGNPRMVNPRRFWWAIPSVTKDPDYPYRMIPAA